MGTKWVSVMGPSALLAWCRSHDWGDNAELVDGFICNLVDHYRAEDGEWIVKLVEFPASDPQAIRDWAGY